MNTLQQFNFNLSDKIVLLTPSDAIMLEIPSNSILRRLAESHFDLVLDGIRARNRISAAATILTICNLV